MSGPGLAVVVDPRGGSPEARRSAVAAALGDGPDLQTHADGPFACAIRGGGLAAADGAVCAIDGSIYNLGAVLSAAEPSAGADASVAALLLRAWRRLGTDFLSLLRGDFVLVLWDGESTRGLAVRDQLGGRGLVWRREGERLLCASEIRPLLRLLGRTPGPDHAAVAHWLAVSGMPGDRSLYDGVRRLRAAHLLPLGEEGGEPRRWWRPPYRDVLRASREEIVAELRGRMTTAVERRLAPDGSSAVMLSGGLDSAAVAAAASIAEHRGSRPSRAYSATFPDHPSVDEGPLIEELCDAYALTGTQVVVRSGSVLSGALPYIDRWALPPVSPNLFFWSRLLERAAADGVAFMVDGEGGDEVFGLSPALIADRLRRGRLRAARELVLRIPGAGHQPSPESIRRIMREYGWKALVPTPVHRAVRALRGAGTYAPPWFRPDAARAFATTDDRHEWKSVRGPRWFAHLLDVTTSGMGPALIYDHVRRRAVMAGLAPPRHPLVDVDLIEYILRIPPEIVFDPELSRPLMREAMTGLLPDSVRLRPGKSTFDAIFHQSLAGADLAVTRRLLVEGSPEIGAWVDLAELHERLFAHPPPERPNALMHWALFVWRMVTAECWLRSLADPGFPERLALEARLEAPDCRLVERPPAG